ncbi:hypothetical protein IWW38_003392 [Coemansia aciculifera]|uniref:Uncharacterized protein n=1 Tax=Coemansia aciculifera TaxID=417176 RepID=A0ACC1M1E7_9FUNG|nr:hypothetical protein IWW38_003392 [Coemansia aciculifera]
MNSLSAFQLLPEHIVELIVNYVDNISDDHIHQVSHGKRSEQPPLHQPLLWVCSNFRAVVYRHYCQQYDLCISSRALESSSVPSVIRCPWVLCSDYNEHSTSHLATKLTVYLDLNWIYSGRALEILSCAPNKDCVFPAAREILFDFSLSDCQTDEGDSVEDVDEQIAHTNIAAFVQRLQQLAPRVREHHLSNDFYGNLDKINTDRFNSLLSLILVDMDSYVYTLGKGWLELDLDYDRVCNLACIDYTIDTAKESLLTLVQQCAPVLQSLRLQHQGTWVGLDMASYPRPRLSFDAVVPFPVLRHINISYYGFGDDTLFRGNAATLESLQMTLDAETVTMLRARRVFTHNSHPYLRSVSTYGFFNLAACGFDTLTDSLRFLLNIGSDAVARAISCGSFEQDVPRVLQLLGKYPAIRALSLQGTYFTYLDVIALIKSLPQLTDLHLYFPKRGAQLAGIPVSQLFDTVVATHAPMGKQLRRFIVHDSYSSVEGLVEFVVLLTSLCPNLDFIDVSKYFIGHIGKHMRECADLPPLQKYEQVMQHMERGGIRNHWLADGSDE